MAVTVTPVRIGPTESIANIEATADADVLAIFAHGLGVTPEQAYLEAVDNGAEYYLSAPYITVRNITNVEVTLANAVGSGGVGTQIRLIVRVPHSLTQ